MHLSLFLFCIFGYAQKGLQLDHGTKQTIRFQLINNVIFIPMNINGTDLTFLLDSGVNQTIIFSIADKELNLKNPQNIKFSGLGEGKDIDGLMSLHNRIKVGKNLTDEDQTIYVILDENINLSKHVGIPVHGIIGYSFFQNHPVMIDFLKKKLTIYKSSDNIPKKIKRFTELPLSIELNKPYLTTEVTLDQKATPTKLLLDLGNSDAIWLFPMFAEAYIKRHASIRDYLGSGFNGDIFGQRSRIKSFGFLQYRFNDPLIAVPDPQSIQNLNLVKDRVGSVGNEIWRRFTLFIDYPNERFYVRKNRNYDAPFEFNKTGIDVIQDGVNWEKDLIPSFSSHASHGNTISTGRNTTGNLFTYTIVMTPNYRIAACRENSPCSVAGLQSGDRIVSLNHKPASQLTLQKIRNIFSEGKDGRRLRVVIERNNVISEHQLTFEDPIPLKGF